MLATWLGTLGLPSHGAWYPVKEAPRNSGWEGTRAVALAPKVQAHLKLEGRCPGHAWICFYCFVFSNVFIKDLFPFMLGKWFSNSVTRTLNFCLFVFFKTIDDMKAFCKKIKK